MHDAPILFFDSGVGGLSVVAPTQALLPRAPIVYAADSAGFPYGTKSGAKDEKETSIAHDAALGGLIFNVMPQEGDLGEIELVPGCTRRCDTVACPAFERGTLALFEDDLLGRRDGAIFTALVA